MGFHKNNKAFTLMELMTVVIIISIIAAFAIPNYQMSLEKAHEKEMATNLRAIAAADEIYRSENGTYWPTGFGAQFIDDINTNLGLGIIENQTRYACLLWAGVGILCQATYPFPGIAKWQLQVDSYSAVPWTVFCSSGPCPTL